MTPNSNQYGFSGLGIAPKLLDVIDHLKFTEPTPVQRQSIPIGVEGKDIIAIAQTGTGKTLAFGIPLIQRLAQIKGRGLILLPTRELAQQVDQALAPFLRAAGMRTAVLIGGESIVHQKRALEKQPRIIVATPGRLIDVLEQRVTSLKDISILVLDEADRMLDMGFAPQINKILALVPNNRQTMLFSATMPSEIVTIARQHMALPVNVEIAPPGTAAEKVMQEVFFVDKGEKSRLLELMLSQHPGPILVFSRTKHGAKKITRYMKAAGHTAAEIHSNRTQAQRRDALEGFKSGKYRVLIATDIAARGIDVTGIEVVINYDLPSNSEDYVHRIGRTGRAGRPGHAISFATFDQERDIRDIEQLIRTALPVSRTPELPPSKPSLYSPRPSPQHRPQSRQKPGRKPSPRQQPSLAAQPQSAPQQQKSTFGRGTKKRPPRGFGKKR